MERFLKCAMMAVGMALVALTAYAKSNSDITAKTVVYAVTEGEELKMDIYTDTSADWEGKRPVILYQHGGGWASFTREEGKSWLTKMARHGYVCASIDYRLGIKRLMDKGEKMDSTEFGKWYGHAITIGIEDYYDATAYLIKHADELGIDTKKIIAAGSSAGAVDVCTAENKIVNKEPIATTRLPEGFNYAAIIAAAGGVWGPGHEAPQWKGTPCPFIMFHGDNDQIVPYDHFTNTASDFSAWGSKTLSRQLRDMKVPYFFLTAKDCDHSLSVLPFSNCREMMQSFLLRVVFGTEQLTQELEETYLDEPRTIPYLMKHLTELEK